jgi:hypothetical protein
MPTISLLAEIAAASGSARPCRALYALLEPFAGANAAHALLRTYGGSTAHYLGLLAAALRRPEDAAAHFETALERNAAMRARPALVRTQLELGRLLAARNRKADERRGREMLEHALAAAEEIGLDGLASQIRAL